MGTSTEAGAAPPAPAAPGRVRRTREETHKAKPCERPSAREPAFAPVVVATSLAPQGPSASASDTSAGRIDIAIGDVVVRVGGQVEASLLTAVLCAVRRAS